MRERKRVRETERGEGERESRRERVRERGRERERSKASRIQRKDRATCRVGANYSSHRHTTDFDGFRFGEWGGCRPQQRQQ